MIMEPLDNLAVLADINRAALRYVAQDCNARRQYNPLTYW